MGVFENGQFQIGSKIVRNLIRYFTAYCKLMTAYLIFEAKKAMILEGIENSQTKAVYKKAKVAMAGKANV